MGDLVGRIALQAGCDVAVQVGGHGDVGVPEPFLHDLRCTPLARAMLVWRRSWRRIVGTPARWTRASNWRETYSGCHAEPWDRTRLDGADGARIWTGQAVLAHNLVKIGALNNASACRASARHRPRTSSGGST